MCKIDFPAGGKQSQTKKEDQDEFPLEPDLSQYTDCAEVYEHCPICERGRNIPHRRI